MGKKHKKIPPKRPHKHDKVCERCGNGKRTKLKVFRCCFCGWMNGVGADEYNVEITKGSFEDR